MVTEARTRTGPPRRLVRRPHDRFARFRTSFRGGDRWRSCCRLGRHAPLWRADSAVDALRGVSHRDPARPVRRRDGPVRLRQVDADAHPRRARHARRPARSGSATRRSPTWTTTSSRSCVVAASASSSSSSTCCPMLTAEQNVVLPLSIAGEDVDARVGRRGDGEGRPGRPPHASAVRAVRRPAAARRDRAGARLAADDPVRRRADRQPRLDDERGDPPGCCATRSTATARRR